MLRASEVLKKLLSEEDPSGSELLHMDNALKSVFYNRGFMTWARKKTMGDMNRDVNEAVNSVMLEHMGIDSEDVLIESVYSVIAVMQQSIAQKVFYHLPMLFLQFDKVFEDKELNTLVDLLKEGLKSRNLTVRTKAAMILSKFAESSNAQARRALAGEASTKTLEVLLKSIGWKENEHFGQRFMYQNSVTDFTVPAVRDWHAYEVQAYIAIQASTNDRAKLTTSAFHSGARRYLCSLNGCSSSSKKTKDISDALARSFRESETYYVVIEKERQDAIKDAKLRIKRNKGTKKEINAKKRLDWLQRYTINYSQFLNELRDINVEFADVKPKSRQTGRR